MGTFALVLLLLSLVTDAAFVTSYTSSEYLQKISSSVSHHPSRRTHCPDSLDNNNLPHRPRLQRTSTSTPYFQSFYSKSRTYTTRLQLQSDDHNRLQPTPVEETKLQQINALGLNGATARTTSDDAEPSENQRVDEIDINVHDNHLQPLPLQEVDVLYQRSTYLTYDPVKERFVRKPIVDNTPDGTSSTDSAFRRSNNFLRNFVRSIKIQLSVALIPLGVTPSYYRFMRWRVLQRFVSSNLNVFGTQSLLLALGIQSKSSRLAALSAALNWVLKDALGKLVRMTWASKMGRRFDSDAKRWRYRSAFIFAAGNGCEIVTYMFPHLFLLWATLANCCKQMSMLTSSSTRTAIYNSFRDGTRENIGDITAKGEAQIAIVDLLGIASGVTLSRMVGTKVQSVLMLYLSLQALELVCMYKQLRSVVYRVLSFERMVQVIGSFCDCTVSANGNGSGIIGETASVGATRDKTLQVEGCGIPTPQDMAKTERIFLPPRHLERRAIAYGSLGRAKLSPTELTALLQVFSKERFLLIVGKNAKNPKTTKKRGWWNPTVGRKEMNDNSFENEQNNEVDNSKNSPAARIQENCHIVLHTAANNMDIVKSTMALVLLRRKLAEAARAGKFDPDTVRSSDCLPLIKESLAETDRHFGLLLRQLTRQGWESPARYMFGRVHMRAEWPLSAKSTVGGGNKSASTSADEVAPPSAPSPSSTSTSATESNSVESTPAAEKPSSSSPSQLR